MHYRFDVIRPFLSTLNTTGYSGDIVLFYSSVDRGTVEKISRKGIILIPFRTCFPHLDPVLAKHVDGWANNKRVGNLGLFCYRFLLAYCYLKEFSRKYRYVMLTDVRDVIFQKDPFDFAINEQLCCFTESEDLSLGKEPYDAAGLELAFDRFTLNQLKDNRIICAGITIGPADLVTGYLEKMIDLFMKAPGKGWEVAAASPGDEPILDQAVHNYLVYNGLLSEVALYANDDGPVLTLGLEKNVSVARSGMIVNKRGNVPNIVHQYDRHWQVAKRFYSLRRIWKHHWSHSRMVLGRVLSVHAPIVHRTLVQSRKALIRVVYGQET